jgi:hypothetical protein
LSYEEQCNEIESVSKALDDNTIANIKWLAYPFGSSEHVNPGTLTWMREHPDWIGVFANGGINRSFHKTEMLRMGIGDCDLNGFKEIIRMSNSKMDKILAPVQ